AGFTRHFAERLNQHCQLYVKEAEQGDLVKKGTALVAPGDKHMIVMKKNDRNYRVKLEDGPLVCRHRPAVDVLFRSVANSAGPNAIGILLTGMGDDGAKSLLEMKENGATTIAQDEESSVVFGMPKEAIKLGAADQVLALHQIPENLIRLAKTI
ncbi:MAG: chemotaxis protein CheB, partial [Proteobacteria bacterium]|nr:chemotaxis protein CheB [Pseudomonadota bacterium]